MLGRFRTLFPQIRVTVIDATVVNQPAAGKENCALGRDAGLSETNQRMARVAQDLLREVVFLDVLPDRLRRGVGVGIHQPESDAGSSELSLNPADFWSVTVGDRTICADKNKGE